MRELFLILTAWRKSRGLMELYRNSHHVFKLMYHFVWITKYAIKYLLSRLELTLKQLSKKLDTAMMGLTTKAE